MSLRIAIVDDLAQDRARIEQMTVEILSGEKVPHSIQVFDDGNCLLEAIRSGEKYQIFLLDVMMDTIGGMELADELRRWSIKPQIIFVSSNREMAMYGYERNAIRYLGKPVQRDKLEEALMHCVSLWQSKKEILENWQCDREFNPALADGERQNLIEGWKKAVKCAISWANDDVSI